MKMKNRFFLSLSLFVTFTSVAQLEELTPHEKAYSDSIASLNSKNAVTAQSQTCYNNGIKFFSEKNYLP